MVVESMTNRFCDLCGWETPSLSIYTRYKKKTMFLGYICRCCGKVHTFHFPTVFLLREDALAIKSLEKSFDEFRPEVKSRRKTAAFFDNFEKKRSCKVESYNKNIEMKIKVQNELNCAVKNGEIQRPKKCQICGLEFDYPLDGHHEDYSKPLDVIWLCKFCHKRIHQQDIALSAFEQLDREWGDCSSSKQLDQVRWMS